MKKTCLILCMLAAVVIISSCASSGTSVTVGTDTGASTAATAAEAPAEKGVSTVDDIDSLVIPNIIMENTTGLSLYKAYEDKGIEIGSCTLPVDFEDAWIREKLVTQFGSFCPFEGFKSAQLLNREESVKNGRLTVVFDDTVEKAVRWARENGKKIHGHALIWWKSNPEWMFRENFSDDAPYVSREVMLERLEDYIRGVFEGIAENGWTDLFYAFDITNEYIKTDGTGPNEGPWTQIIGDDAAWYAFYYSRKHAPSTIKLVFNENYCEVGKDKREAVVEFVKTLVDEKGDYLIDGIGLQCHLFLRNSIESILSGIEYVCSSLPGLEVQLTEVDCTISTKPKVFEDNLKKQGIYMFRLMEKVMELNDNGASIPVVQFSGFRDDCNPLVAVSGASTLYDVRGNEKYAYFGILQMKEYSGFED